MIVSDDTESRIRKIIRWSRTTRLGQELQYHSVRHTRISNNNGAFASVVNECERTRDLSSLFQVFFLCVCVFLKASYTFSWKVSCYFEYWLLICMNHHIWLVIQPVRSCILKYKWRTPHLRKPRGAHFCFSVFCFLLFNFSLFHSTNFGFCFLLFNFLNFRFINFGFCFLLFNFSVFHFIHFGFSFLLFNVVVFRFIQFWFFVLTF